MLKESEEILAAFIHRATVNAGLVKNISEKGENAAIKIFAGKMLAQFLESLETLTKVPELKPACVAASALIAKDVERMEKVIGQLF